MRIVDLSFPIRPHFRWKVAPERVATHAAGDPLQSTVLTISCHAYTHVDAPLHITVIEYLTNLGEIGAARCRFLALPLRLEGADGSPVRAIALVE